MVEPPRGWQMREKPATLFRRFEFDRYAATRQFLDDLAALAEELGMHPQNINFGATYVNVTLEASVPGEGIGPAELAFAERVNALIRAEG